MGGLNGWVCGGKDGGFVVIRGEIVLGAGKRGILNCVVVGMNFLTIGLHYLDRWERLPLGVKENGFGSAEHKGSRRVGKLH